MLCGIGLRLCTRQVVGLSYIRENEVLNICISMSGNEAKRVAKFRHSTRNASRIRRKVENEES